MTSIWHWMILLSLVLLFFSLGKIPRLLGDLASGIKASKKKMKKDQGGAAQAGNSNASNTDLVNGPVNSSSSSQSSGKWKFVGAAVGGILGALMLGAASLPLFGVLAVPRFVFGVYYGGKVGSVFDYIEKR